jgi:hypothetical protein
MASEEFLFLFGTAIRLLLVGAAFDTKPTIGVTGEAFGFVITIWDVGSPVILLHPGINMLDIEDNDFPQTRNFILQGGNCSRQQVLQECLIRLSELLTEPIAARESELDIKAVTGESPIR